MNVRGNGSLKGTDAPADPEERIAFATVWYFRGFTLRSAEQYREVFADDPAWAADYQGLYDAACSAARCGTGRGTEAVGLDETARLAWRRQALEWLRRFLEIPLPPTATLEGILYDADLSGIRDEAELAKLTPDEREEWRGFWMEVRKKLAGETE